MKLPKKCPPQTRHALDFCTALLHFENRELEVSERSQREKTTAALSRSPPLGKAAQSAGPEPRLTCADQESRPGRRATVPFRGRRREHRNRDKDGVRRLGPTQRPPPPRPGNACPPPAAGPAERGAAPGNSPPGAAAGGGPATPSPRGLVLNSLRGRGRRRRRRAAAPQTGSTAVPRPSQARLPRRCDPAHPTWSLPPGAEDAPRTALRRPESARGAAGGARGRAGAGLAAPAASGRSVTRANGGRLFLPVGTATPCLFTRRGKCRELPT